MRLLTFVRAAGEEARLGLFRETGDVLDVAEEADRGHQALPFDPTDMVSLIASGERGLRALRDLMGAPRVSGLPVGDLRILAPLRPRKNVFCVGWNYLEHLTEDETFRSSRQELPEHPVFFSKATNSLNGPFDPIPYDARISEQIDWEAELGVVVGERGKNIAEADAMRHVFGYTVVNDVSARDLQKRHGQWLKGKSLDGFCPMGPYLVTADEVDPGDLRIITRVNGVVKQDSSTRHLFFKIPRLLAELSLGLTLEPGDVLSTGTPPGVGFARKPPEYLAPGDVLETEIVGLGVMRNTIQGR